MINKDLVYKCLYNFLGYGNPNSKYWFLGKEEGAIWKHIKFDELDEQGNIEKVLKQRASFQIAMDFIDVWENKYSVKLETFKGASTWRFIASFILAFEDKPNDNIASQNFIFQQKKLGKKNANHFLLEFLPLPKNSGGRIDPYSQIWKHPKDYNKEVALKRFEQIKKTLEENLAVEYIISYDKFATDYFKKYFHFKEIKKFELGKSTRKQKYLLYKFEMSNKRKIHFLSTPFFGNGWISYNCINEIVSKIKE